MGKHLKAPFFSFGPDMNLLIQRKCWKLSQASSLSSIMVHCALTLAVAPWFVISAYDTVHWRGTEKAHMDIQIKHRELAAQHWNGDVCLSFKKKKKNPQTPLKSKSLSSRKHSFLLKCHVWVCILHQFVYNGIQTNFHVIPVLFLHAPLGSLVFKAKQAISPPSSTSGFHYRCR